jgi:hypothetical protein
MVDITTGMEQLKTQLSTNLKARLEENYYTELRSKMTSDPNVHAVFYAPILQVYLEMQQAYFGKGAAASEDPTKFLEGTQVEAIKAEVTNNLKHAASKLNKDTASNLTIELLRGEFTGEISPPSKDEKELSPVRWTVFFLHGAFYSDLLWINSSNYKLLKGYTPGHLGRFGVGHLWHVPNERYGDTVASFKKRLKDADVPESYDQLKHPQSGQKGNPAWFEGVWPIINRNLDHSLLQPALKTAMDKTMSGTRINIA